MSRVPFKEKGAKNTHLSFRPYIYTKGRKPIRVDLAPKLEEHSIAKTKFTSAKIFPFQNKK